jgi:endonuclease G
LESACRRWAKKEGRIYIVCGPVFNAKKHRTIGKDIKVAVPDSFFKVVMSNRKNAEKAIGFYYNNTGERQTMGDAVRSVDEIEELTGMDFFHTLDSKLERRIEANAKLTEWR